MSFVIGLVLGALLGAGGVYLREHPERWDELKALFRRKE